VRVDAENAPSWVMVCRDVSATGMLLAAPQGADFDPDTAVTLTFTMPLDDIKDTLQGRIVRVAHNPGTDGFLWPWMVGVEFDHPNARLRRLAEDVAGAPELQ
jgi:hypothetical protein